MSDINFASFDENEHEEKEDVSEERPHKSLDQMKYETMIVRIGIASLVCSAMMFIGQIVAVASVWRQDPGSSVTGFGLCLFLFLIWVVINSVYGQNKSLIGGMKETLIPTPMSFNFRIRSVEEMRLMIPAKWLIGFAITYIVTSIIISTCEAYLISLGIISYYSDLGPIRGFRIAFSVVFISTAVTCICLATKLQRRSTAIALFLFAILSLVAASFLSSFWYLRADMRFLSTMNYKDYEETKTKVLSHMTKTEDGKILFPLKPWSFIMVAMNCFPLLLITLSVCLIFVCLNMFFSIKIMQGSTNEPQEKKTSLIYISIGTILLIVGFAINVGMIIVPNLGHFDWMMAMEWIYKPMTFSTLSLLFGGFLALSIGTSEKLSRKFGLLMHSFVMLASLIVLLMHTSHLLNETSYVHSYGDFECVKHNESHMCLEAKCVSGSGYDYYGRNTRECNLTDACIETPKVCDGVLDLLSTYNNTPIDKEGCDYTPHLKIHYFADELFCGKKWEGVYAMIFGSGAIGILCCIAIWIISFNTLLMVFKLIRNAVRQIFCAQIPLQ
eukprot:11955.XXX_370405_372069_1 [CDS] Oithona nana genome sequencing.